jgi:hypothetical protein
MQPQQPITTEPKELGGQHPFSSSQNNEIQQVEIQLLIGQQGEEKNDESEEDGKK